MRFRCKIYLRGNPPRGYAVLHTVKENEQLSVIPPSPFVSFSFFILAPEFQTTLLFERISFCYDKVIRGKA